MLVYPLNRLLRALEIIPRGWILIGCAATGWLVAMGVVFGVVTLGGVVF